MATRLGGRRRSRRTLSLWDFARAPDHAAIHHRPTCGSGCGVMAEHKRRMRLRASERRAGQRLAQAHMPPGEPGYYDAATRARHAAQGLR